MRWLLCCVLFCLCGPAQAADPVPRNEYVQVSVVSTLDQSQQPSLVWLPEGNEPRPLLVFLHSWSSDLNQRNTAWLEQAKAKRWAFLHPNFRGRNNQPEACGSELAQQDILDAMKWVMEQMPIDRSRVYLAGTSGGGHMTLLMAGKYPDKFTAASSWVGISDLAQWHAQTSQARGQARYAQDIEACVGGKPGASPAVDEQLRLRSPVFHLAAAKDLPVDINTGVHDGHTGSVPVSQSFAAFNAIVKGRSETPIDDEVIRFWTAAGAETIERPVVEVDAGYGRAILFRARSGDSRLTVFEGTHEDRPLAGMAFLESFQRATNWP